MHEAHELWTVTSSNTLQYCFNVVFLCNGFLDITVSIDFSFSFFVFYYFVFLLVLEPSVAKGIYYLYLLPPFYPQSVNFSGKLNFCFISDLESINQEDSRGSMEFPNQSLRQIGHGFLRYDQKNKHTDKQK